MAYLVTGFDLNRLGAMSVAVNDGTDSGTATVTVARYCHRDLTSLSAVLGSGNYAVFSTAVDTAIDAVLTTHGGGCSVNLATGAYTLGTYNAATTLDFTSAAGQRLAAALGFTAAHANGAGSGYSVTLSGATSYTSNVTPYYYLALARDGLTAWSRPYDVQGQTKHVTTTLANGYGIAPTTKTQFVDFKLKFQTLAGTFPNEAASTAPWTFQDLMDHVNTWEPVAVSTTGTEFVYKDREGDLTQDRREPQWNDYHAYWTVNVAGQFVGWL